MMDGHGYNYGSFEYLIRKIDRSHGVVYECVNSGGGCEVVALCPSSEDSNPSELSSLSDSLTLDDGAY